MTKIQIHYWSSFRGLGERVKLLVQYLGLDYEFVGKAYGTDEWPKQKAGLLKVCPLINLPYLVDGDTIVAESQAVMVYLCVKANREDLLGRDAQQKVALTAMRGAFDDAFKATLNSLLVVPGTWQEQKDKLEQNIMARLNKFDAFLGPKQYLAGGLTIIDFVVMDGVSVYNLMFDERPIKTFKNLAAWYERVNNLETVNSYKTSDRYKERPVQKSSSKWY